MYFRFLTVLLALVTVAMSARPRKPVLPPPSRIWSLPPVPHPTGTGYSPTGTGGYTTNTTPVPYPTGSVPPMTPTTYRTGPTPTATPTATSYPYPYHGSGSSNRRRLYETPQLGLLVIGGMAMVLL